MTSILREGISCPTIGVHLTTGPALAAPEPSRPTIAGIRGLWPSRPPYVCQVPVEANEASIRHLGRHSGGRQGAFGGNRCGTVLSPQAARPSDCGFEPPRHTPVEPPRSPVTSRGGAENGSGRLLALRGAPGTPLRPSRGSDCTLYKGQIAGFDRPLMAAKN